MYDARTLGIHGYGSKRLIYTVLDRLDRIVQDPDFLSAVKLVASRSSVFAGF